MEGEDGSLGSYSASAYCRNSTKLLGHAENGRGLIGKHEVLKQSFAQLATLSRAKAKLPALANPERTLLSHSSTSWFSGIKKGPPYRVALFI
jgi:hypothetical protein